MSAQYDLYLQHHRSNVHKGFKWFQQNLPELLVDGVGSAVLLVTKKRMGHEG